jgi:type IV secretory pathway VirB2 component (pilin)
MNNENMKSSQQMVDTAWQVFLLFAITAGTMMIPMEALAGATANAVEIALCNVVSYMTSTTGKAIATLAIIIVGLGALMGKVSWGMALIVALGVALVFGAATIVDSLGASGSDCSGYKAIPTTTTR